MDKFISSFNESKSITRVDKGMWVDGDRGGKGFNRHKRLSIYAKYAKAGIYQYKSRSRIYPARDGR